MSKHVTTKTIEKRLIMRFIRTSTRFALEVPIGVGIADFVTADISYQANFIPVITVWEIKISWTDFNSKNGKNFVGDHNYYILTEDLFDYIQEKRNKNTKYINIFGDCGVYILTKRGGLLKKIDSTRYNQRKMALDSKYRTLDSMLMRWESGTMYRELKYHNIRTRN